MSAALLTTGPAWAGWVAEQPVQIAKVDSNRGGTSGWASGSTATARETHQSDEMIYCSNYGSVFGTNRANCMAVDASGDYLACITYEPLLVEVARSIPSYGRLEFGVDENGHCKYINVGTGSLWLP